MKNKKGLVVLEGEFNSLMAETIKVRTRNIDSRIKNINTIAIGSANNVDFSTIQKIDKNPIIGRDNDLAGENVVKMARQYMHIKAFTTPLPQKDLDEFIIKYGTDYVEASKAMLALIDDAVPFYKFFEPVAEEVIALRNSKDKDFLISQKTAALMIDDLEQRGVYYHDTNNCYYFDNEDNKLMSLTKEDASLKILLAEYKINASEKLWFYILEELNVYAMKKGVKTTIHNYCYYNQATFTIYISNFDNRMYRITKEKIDLVSNGTDSVLFLPDCRYKPFKLKDIKDDDDSLNKIITSQINFDDCDLTLEENRTLFTTWLFTLFFESIMKSKTVAAFIGTKGSGKSLCAKKVGITLFGDWDVTPLGDPKDFDTAVSNSYFIAIDNADTKTSWLDDRIATLATGATIKRRLLYTTNSLVEYTPRCFLAITARTPTFRRDDISERLLIFRLKRIDKFIAENIILSEVTENREQILSEIAKKLQKILATLEEMKDFKYEGKVRMGDFADLGYKIAVSEGKEKEIQKIYEKLSKIHTDFTLENDPLCDLIDQWLEKGNEGYFVTTKELYRHLSSISNLEGETFLIRNHRSLAQKLNALKANLENYYVIEEKVGGGRERKIAFSFKKEVEPKDMEQIDPFYF